MGSCSFIYPQLRKSPDCSYRGARGVDEGSTHLPAGTCHCLSLTPQGRTTPPPVPCARGLSSLGEAVFSFWVLGLGVLLRSPSVAQTEPARGRASLLRAFGQVTPVLLQLCQLSRPPAPGPESQGEGRILGSRSAGRGGQQTTTCEETPGVPCGSGSRTWGRAGGAVGRFPEVLIELSLPSPRQCLYPLTSLFAPQPKCWPASQRLQRAMLGAKQPQIRPGSSPYLLPLFRIKSGGKSGFAWPPQSQRGRDKIPIPVPNSVPDDSLE